MTMMFKFPLLFEMFSLNENTCNSIKILLKCVWKGLTDDRYNSDDNSATH